MKASTKFFEEVKSELEKLPMQELIHAYENGDFARSDLVTDLNTRFRWDLFWAIEPKLSNECHIELDHLNDHHIDTVLRKIVPTIVRKYS